MGEPLDAIAVVNRLRELYGVLTDTALADALRVPNTTISSWRSRNRVPYEECVEAVRKFRVSFDWLLLGRGERSCDAATGLPAAATDDPRLQRLAGFLAEWAATRSDDEKAWLEMQLARAVPEYAEWVAARTRQ